MIFLLFALYYSLQAAENTLLNKQLEAINRQLNAERIQSGELDPGGEEVYEYNQNAVDIQEPQRSSRMYVGASGFIGNFVSKSGDQAYNVKDSTSFAYYRLGYIFETGNRVELSLVNGATLSYDDFEDHISGINLNMIIAIPMNKEKTVYTKLQGGVGIYDYSKFGLEGVSLNPAAGIIFDITPDVELDITYQYQIILWRDFEDLSGSSEIKNTTLRGLSVGLKYKF